MDKRAIANALGIGIRERVGENPDEISPRAHS
jgi:hypothetical protein